MTGTKIDIYDGTRDSRAGTAFMAAVGTLAKTRQKAFSIFPDPRKIDAINLRRYNIVQSFAGLNYVPGRKQVDVSQIPIQMADAKGLEEIIDVDSLKVLILDDDIFCGEDSNWCIGVANGVVHTDANGREHERDFLTVTTYAAKTLAQLKDRFLHELGHQFGAAPEGRANTYENLGPHCDQYLCIMQQRDTREGQEELSRARVRARAPAYCGKCTTDLIHAARAER
jgi:hypothetical protein